MTGKALTTFELASCRLVASTKLEQCIFHNNSAVDPWAWPATTTVPGVSAATSPNQDGRYVAYWGPPQGYGGAIFTNDAGFQVVGAQTVMTYNKAVYGTCPGSMGWALQYGRGVRGPLPSSVLQAWPRSGAVGGSGAFLTTS